MPKPEEVLEGLLKAVSRRLFGMARDVMDKHGFPASTMPIMHDALRFPGSTISDIARRTGMAKSHISRTVENLAAKGFLEKRPDPTDQRLMRVYSTEQAESRFRAVQENMRRRLSAVLAALPPQKVDALVDGLRELQNALEQDSVSS